MKKTKRMNVKLTDEMRDAISFAISLAVDDQEHWMNYGDPGTDYGDEWPEVARSKAAGFTEMAQVLVALELDGESCLSLAADFEAAADEAEAGCVR